MESWTFARETYKERLAFLLSTSKLIHSFLEFDDVWQYKLLN